MRVKKYLEQTELIWNPIRDGRKQGRWQAQCFVPGTRWEYDEDTRKMTGDGMTIDGPIAEEIRAICKEVEPGFGVIVDEFNYEEVIGRLIDDGKITVADLQDVLNDDNDDVVESDDVDDEEWPKYYRRHELDSQMYNYRHWRSLTPPNDTLSQAVAEDERQDAIMREYNERTKRDS